MIETLAFVLTGLGLTASIVYYANILNNANKSRERELINQRITMIDVGFYAKWRQLLNGKWSTYQEWQKHRSENIEDSDILAYMCTLLNTIGLLHKNKMLDSDLIFGIYQPNLFLWTWEKVAPIVYGNRDLLNNPEQYSGFEYLYNEAKKQYPNFRSLEEFLQARQEYSDNTVN